LVGLRTFRIILTKPHELCAYINQLMNSESYCQSNMTKIVKTIILILLWALKYIHTIYDNTKKNLSKSPK